MLATGRRKLERMRDGRAVYIGAERVDDVTAHPAFRQGAQTIAELYDLKADPAKRELFSYEENGERYGLQWLRCRTRDDLARRMRALQGERRRDLRLHRPLARAGRRADHRAGDEPVGAGAAARRASATTCIALLGACAPATISISASR